ncbi:MAG TPA: cell division protein FtsZ [Caldithrix abyssi]|uniref:Cell division protein FtsZ n=1 Tax=Caldithrix abyssi TaxID=187145 RepID=A0A7V5RPI3_CALAY|nr:cell division protein FtsZ [Caldithrix abyssi]
MIQFDASAEQAAKIKVVGVGGAGGNAINGMIEAGLSGVEFIVINTDAQDLEKNLAPNKIQIGKSLTKGLGAGANPEFGMRAIEEDKEIVVNALNGADMVFVTCGMGGGTGTGAAPVVAEVAKDLGALTVGIVTTPFMFEGPVRSRNAEKGISVMRERVDTMLVIPNERIFSIIDKKTSVVEAFQKVDSILMEATRSISDLINVHGYINLDFADVRTIMAGMGDALMGSGMASGENRALAAAEQAITSPLLDGAEVSGARGVLINITGSSSLSMFEIGEAASLIQQASGDGANVIWGMVIDEDMGDQLRVTVIATGFNRDAQLADQMQKPKKTVEKAILSGNDFEPNDFEELDKPTFKRERKKIDPLKRGGSLPLFSFDEEEALPEGPDNLDIPTFLRKQID